MTIKWHFSNSTLNGSRIGNSAVSCLQLSQFRSFIAEELRDPEGLFFPPPKHCTENNPLGGHRVTWKIAV